MAFLESGSDIAPDVMELRDSLPTQMEVGQNWYYPDRKSLHLIQMTGILDQAGTGKVDIIG